MKVLRNFLLIAILFTGWQVSNAQSTDAINYGPRTTGSIISSPLAMGDLLGNYNSDSTLAAASQAGYGVVWTGSNFIVSNFNANLFFRYDRNFVKRDSFAVTGGLGFFRDMAFVRGILWGVNNTSNPGQIIGIDTGSKAVVKVITTTLTGLRGITWDPQRIGFWVGTNSFSGPAICVDTNGTIIPGATFAPGSIYGIGYDVDPTGPSYITISRDMTPANTTQTVIARYNASTLVKFDSIVVTVPLQTPATTLASGGSECYNNLVPGKRVSLGLVQSTPHRVIIVELGSLPAPPNPTTWYEQTTPITTALYTASAPDINVAWAAGVGGKVLRTTNGGTWTQNAGTLPVSDVYAMWAFDALNCLVTESPSATFVYRTTDGGTSWAQVLTQPNGFFDGFYFKDNNNGLVVGDAVGGRSSIWKTTNGGLNWDSTGVNFATNDASWNNAISGVGDVVYYGTNATKLYKSTNFGTTWTPTTPTGEANSEALWFNTATNGLIGGATTVQQTTTGGSTFTTVTAPGTGAVLGITGTATDNYWLIRGSSVYKTTNTGATWTTDYTSPGTATFNYIVKARNGSPYLYAVKTNGTISKYGGSTTGINPGNPGIVGNYSLNQNYPNPFNPTTKISFALPVSGLVTLKVYDMLGKEVANLVNEQMNSGSYSIDFNAASLSSGIYFYTLKSGSFTETKKMLLVK